jgi:hypothetical protein
VVKVQSMTVLELSAFSQQGPVLVQLWGALMLARGILRFCFRHSGLLGLTESMIRGSCTFGGQVQLDLSFIFLVVSQHMRKWYIDYTKKLWKSEFDTRNKAWRIGGYLNSHGLARSGQ